jgi:hypothetical protein
MYVVYIVTPHSNVIRLWLSEGDFSWVQKGRRENKQRRETERSDASSEESHVDDVVICFILYSG